MDTEQKVIKGTNLSAIVLAVLALALLVFGYSAPVLAARDVLRPPMLAFLPFEILCALAGLSLIGLVFIVFDRRIRSSGIVLTSTAAACLIFYIITAGRGTAGQEFLKAATNRIKNEGSSTF